MTTEELRNILLSILDGYERLITENLALRAVLQSEVPERDPQRQVQGLIEDMKNVAFRHPKFDTLRRQYDDLRQQIQQAAEDHQLMTDKPRVASLADLTVVCANCHMLLHLNPKRALQPSTLRAMLQADLADCVR